MDKSDAIAESAREYASAWARAQGDLEALRLRELRALTEAESALRFSRLLSPAMPPPLRASSGLVEQQLIFNRLRAAAR